MYQVYGFIMSMPPPPRPHFVKRCTIRSCHPQEKVLLCTRNGLVIHKKSYRYPQEKVLSCTRKYIVIHKKRPCYLQDSKILLSTRKKGLVIYKKKRPCYPQASQGLMVVINEVYAISGHLRLLCTTPPPPLPNPSSLPTSPFDQQQYLSEPREPNRARRSTSIIIQLHTHIHTCRP